MKKIFAGMVAILALFTTSCQNESDMPNAGKAADVTFSINTPEMSRAYSDGTTATHLQYAVYDEEGNYLPRLTVTDAVINGSTKVELELTTGNTYTVIFWAAATNAPYTVDFAAKTMKVNYNGALSNDENRDAFYKLHTFTVSGTQTETIELRRPFAQVNVGTNDFGKAADSGYEPQKSALKVNNVYKTLNLWDGTVSNPTSVTYDYAAIPTAEKFPVDGYDYISMNYLLVAAQKALVDIEFGYTETDANAAKTRTVGSVPVQRNYRTNIFGKLFTSTVDVNVVIVPEYEEPDYEMNLRTNVANSAELADALENAAENSTIVLTEDINYGSVTLGSLKNVTIYGTGKSTATILTDANSNLENVTIQKIAFKYDGSNVNSGIVINAEATIKNLVIDNCTFEGTGEKKGRGIYGQNPNATITISDCTFKNLGYPIYAMAAGGYKVLTVEGCTFEGIKSWAIMPLYNNQEGDLTVNGNKFVNCVGGLVKTGAFVAGKTFTFTNNVVNDCSYGSAVGKDNWFSIDLSTNGANAVISGNIKDGQAWNPGAADGLK